MTFLKMFFFFFRISVGQTHRPSVPAANAAQEEKTSHFIHPFTGEHSRLLFDQ
jgi:hypothetical protein